MENWEKKGKRFLIRRELDTDSRGEDVFKYHSQKHIV